MADELVNYIIDTPIHTKIEDIRKKTVNMPKEKLVERIQATTTELVKLQYQMREYSVLEWYETLGTRQKKLHNFFEEHVDELKKQSDGNNWVVLCDKEFEPSKIIKGFKKFNDDTDVWIGFIPNAKKVEKVTKEYSKLRLEGMLYTPLFFVSK